MFAKSSQDRLFLNNSHPLRNFNSRYLWMMLLALIINCNISLKSWAEEPLGDPPEITSFDGEDTGGGVWIFSGTLTDEDPGTVEVTFLGVIEGHAVTANSDGTFQLVVSLESGIGGVAGAEPEDIDGNHGETALMYIE